MAARPDVEGRKGDIYEVVKLKGSAATAATGDGERETDRDRRRQSESVICVKVPDAERACETAREIDVGLRTTVRVHVDYAHARAPFSLFPLLPKCSVGSSLPYIIQSPKGRTERARASGRERKAITLIAFWHRSY